MAASACEVRSLRIRNTFIDTAAQRSPSLDRFFRERELQTCPASGAGQLRAALEEYAEAETMGFDGSLSSSSSPSNRSSSSGGGQCEAEADAPTRCPSMGSLRAEGTLKHCAVVSEPLDFPSTPSFEHMPMFVHGSLLELAGRGAPSSSSAPARIFQGGVGSPPVVSAGVAAPVQPFFPSGLPVAGGLHAAWSGAGVPSAPLPVVLGRSGGDLPWGAPVPRAAAPQAPPAAPQHSPRVPLARGDDGAAPAEHLKLPAPPAQLLPPAPPSEPAVGSPELPSAGSAGHAAGECKPCAFYHAGRCQGGVLCTFCHLCDAEERKRRRKAKLESRRADYRARQAALAAN